MATYTVKQTHSMHQAVLVNLWLKNWSKKQFSIISESVFSTAEWSLIEPYVADYCIINFTFGLKSDFALIYIQHFWWLVVISFCTSSTDM